MLEILKEIKKIKNNLKHFQILFLHRTQTFFFFLLSFMLAHLAAFVDFMLVTFS